LAGLDEKELPELLIQACQKSTKKKNKYRSPHYTLGLLMMGYKLAQNMRHCGIK
jgi:hypothetical protein